MANLCVLYDPMFVTLSLQALSHGFHIDDCPCTPWFFTMSFICIGRTSCFPELLCKALNCESALYSSQKVNGELWVTDFDLNYASTIFTLSSAVYCFRSIRVKIQGLLFDISENEKEIFVILEILRIQKVVTFYWPNLYLSWDFNVMTPSSSK